MHCTCACVTVHPSHASKPTPLWPMPWATCSKFCGLKGGRPIHCSVSWPSGVGLVGMTWVWLGYGLGIHVLYYWAWQIVCTISSIPNIPTLKCLFMYMFMYNMNLAINPLSAGARSFLYLAYASTQWDGSQQVNALSFFHMSILIV